MPTKTYKHSIGIDIGGVIIDREKNDDSDTSLFGDNYLNALAVPGAFDAIKRLSKGAFQDAIWIVSKCGDKIERRSREWLRHTGFSAIVPEERWRFCRERHQKAPIAKDLGLTYFVDDKLEVLHHMYRIVPHRLLFRPMVAQVKQWLGESSNGIQIWLDWNDLAASLENLKNETVEVMTTEEKRHALFSGFQRVSQDARSLIAPPFEIDFLFLAAEGSLKFDQHLHDNAQKVKDFFIGAQEWDLAAQVRDLIMTAKKMSERQNV